ncbi:DUF6233 domain-containing protein [Streptomyces sp. NPDC001502]|uniref:DUF6233 domain-containing protein n=1 Tax=Streptomyces sp. NPDC001502 TaxID=3364578 RepID=UPI003689B8BB
MTGSGRGGSAHGRVRGRGEGKALAASRRPRPDSPAWLVERGIGVGRLPVRVHAGQCWDTGKRCAPIDEQQARRALARLPAPPIRASSPSARLWIGRTR